MSRLIIRHKDFILRVHTSENNTTIFDSYQVKCTEDMKSILYLIRDSSKDISPVDTRGIKDMVREWRAHNLLYSLSIIRNKTKNVDLNSGQKWYTKVGYMLLSPLYLHFS